MKLSVLALALGVTFSGSAFATSASWDTATPWGSAATAQYAEWNVFNGTTDTSPEVALSAGTTASLTENTGLAFLVGGNIYSWQAPTSFTATLGGTTGGLFDVYLRIGTLGSIANVTATLNAVSATAEKVETIGPTTIVMGGVSAEQEVYWKWSGVSGSSLYTFNFSASSSSMSLDQLALATVAVPTTPVPEPEAYGMMAMGLGLVALARRRAGKTKA